MFSPINCCKWYRLVLALMLISLYGCSAFRPDQWYLHNPAKKELADQAKSNWTPVKDNLWQGLLKNQQLTADAELQAQRLLQQSIVSSNHISMVNWTWSEMLENLIDHQNKLGVQNKTIEKEKKETLENATEAGKKIEALLNETKSRESAVKKAQENKDRWQKELEVFETASHDFLLQQASQPENTQDFLKQVEEQATGIIGKEGISKLIPKDGIAAKPPGVTLEILTLGADLAKAQLEREKAIEERLQKESALFDKRQEEINAALKWANQAVSEINSNRLVNKSNGTVLVSIQKSLKNNTVPDTEGLISILQKCVLADDLYTLTDNTYNISKEALIRHYEIVDSEIAVKEREALVQRGLETLAVYHNGGITQEEINSILQAAQAVALAVISAGVI